MIRYAFISFAIFCILGFAEKMVMNSDRLRDFLDEFDLADVSEIVIYAVFYTIIFWIVTAAGYSLFAAARGILPPL